jgi:hypothetical protein
MGWLGSTKEEAEPGARGPAPSDTDVDESACVVDSSSTVSPAANLGRWSRFADADTVVGSVAPVAAAAPHAGGLPARAVF